MTLTLVSCSSLFSNDANVEKLQVSGLNSNFNFDTHKPFNEYVTYSRQIIEQGRVDLISKNQKNIIDWNAPFILPIQSDCSPKTTQGILLIHGLSDSPFTTRALAEHFNHHCFLVYSLLLTGHGTRPGDLLEVSYKDWIQQVSYAINELANQVDEIYLGGFSTGAALAFHHVLTDSAQAIKGIISLAPALHLDRIVALSPVVGFFKKWVSIYDDVDWVKYESFPYNAATQVYYLTQSIQKQLKKKPDALKNIQIFAALTYEDKTINAKKTLNTLLNYTNKKNRYLLLYYQNELPLKLIKEKNVYPFQSSIIEEKIFDLAHISLPNAPDNYWYGKKGHYRNCLHYYAKRNKNQNYDLCLSSNDIFYGEKTQENLNQGILARLTYNPFMDNLLINLDHFLGINRNDYL